MGSAKHLLPTSQRKLMMELRQLHRAPLRGVGAQPQQDDMTQVCVNFEFRDGEYRGALLHLHLEYTADFPAKPPKVELLTPVPTHSHTYDQRICFSLVNDFQEWFAAQRTPQTALWNPGVTLRHFLDSLYLHLHTDQDQERCRDAGEHRANVRRVVEQSRRFHCPKCGHNPHAPHPPVYWDEPPPAEVALDGRELWAKAQRHYACFVSGDFAGGPRFSRLCFGLERKLRPDGSLDYLCPVPCVIAKESFDDLTSGTQSDAKTSADRRLDQLWPGVKSPLGADFHAVFPCVVHSQEQWPAVEHLAHEQLQHLVPLIPGLARDLKQVQKRTTASFDFEQVLGFVGELWKGLSVKLMLEEGDRLFASEACLASFFQIHHVLLAIEKAKPGLRSYCTRSVERFCSQPRYRRKLSVPDTGRWLVRLVLADVPWPRVAPFLVEENLARSAYWVLQKDPQLATDLFQAQTDDERRDHVRRFFAGAQTGVKVNAMGCHFARQFRPLTLAQLDQTYGLMDDRKLAQFQQDVREIQGIGSYAEFFAHIGYVLPHDGSELQALHAVLQCAVQQSERCGYHGVCAVCERKTNSIFRHCERHKCVEQGCPRPLVGKGRWASYCPQHQQEKLLRDGYCPLVTLPPLWSHVEATDWLAPSSTRLELQQVRFQLPIGLAVTGRGASLALYVVDGPSVVPCLPEFGGLAPLERLKRAGSASSLNGTQSRFTSDAGSDAASTLGERLRRVGSTPRGSPEPSPPPSVVSDSPEGLQAFAPERRPLRLASLEGASPPSVDRRPLRLSSLEEAESPLPADSGSPAPSTDSRRTPEEEPPPPFRPEPRLAFPPRLVRGRSRQGSLPIDLGQEQFPPLGAAPAKQAPREQAPALGLHPMPKAVAVATVDWSLTGRSSDKGPSASQRVDLLLVEPSGCSLWSCVPWGPLQPNGLGQQWWRARQPMLKCAGACADMRRLELFVADPGSRCVWVLDAEDGELKRCLDGKVLGGPGGPQGLEPHAVCVDAPRETLWVSELRLDRVVGLRLQDGLPLYVLGAFLPKPSFKCELPVALCVNAKDKVLYIANRAANHVREVDLSALPPPPTAPPPHLVDASVPVAPRAAPRGQTLAWVLSYEASSSKPKRSLSYKEAVSLGGASGWRLAAAAKPLACRELSFRQPSALGLLHTGSNKRTLAVCETQLRRVALVQVADREA